MARSSLTRIVSASRSCARSRIKKRIKPSRKYGAEIPGQVCESPQITGLCLTFKPDGHQTDVSWSMSGHRSFITKEVCLFMDLDKLIGGDFEKCLAKLKANAEAKK